MRAFEHAVPLVGLDLPPVRRMDLLDVDDVEVGLILPLTVDAIEGPSLGPEGRSGIAAEDEGDGPSATRRLEVAREAHALVG
jgi:hypothetical protein